MFGFSANANGVLTMKMLTMMVALTALAASAEFRAGFARREINPPMGSCIPGYFSVRPVSGVIDDIEANAVAFSDGTSTAVVVSLDLVEIKGLCTEYRRRAAAATGLAPEMIYLACTHTHTGGCVGKAADAYEIAFDGPPAYDELVGRRIVEVCQAAIADLKPARMLQGRTEAKGVSFVRRFRMRDGRATTNPGRNNPDIVAPIGTPDEDVQIVRLVRDGADEILLVNFQCHPDCIGGTLVSADWPGVVRRTLEGSLGDVKCVFFNGAEGDTNHIDVHPDPKRPLTGKCAASRHFGRTVAGAVLAAYDFCAPVATGRVRATVKEVPLPLRDRTGEDLAAAKADWALHTAGRQGEIKGHRYRLVEAARIVRLVNEPKEIPFPIAALTIGDVLCFTGLPCEPFTEYGRFCKRNSPFGMTFYTCLTDGSFGYLPTAEGCSGDSYESNSTIFSSACEDIVRSAQKALLDDLGRGGQRP